MTRYPQVWITDETPPRGIIVKGESAIDPDCLVGYLEGESKPLWIVYDGDFNKLSYVCGLGCKVYARRINAEQPKPKALLLPAGRHEAYR